MASNLVNKEPENPSNQEEKSKNINSSGPNNSLWWKTCLPQKGQEAQVKLYRQLYGQVAGKKAGLKTALKLENQSEQNSLEVCGHIQADIEPG